MKLCGVGFKINNKKAICAIQLHFHNGMKSKAFEAIEEMKYSMQKWQIAEIDPQEQLGSIETCLAKEGSMTKVVALRFKNKNGTVIQHLGTHEIESSEWHKRELPEGKELIGLSVGMNTYAICKLGFAVWKPNHQLEEYTLKPQFHPRWKPNLTKSPLFGL